MLLQRLRIAVSDVKYHQKLDLSKLEFLEDILTVKHVHAVA